LGFWEAAENRRTLDRSYSAACVDDFLICYQSKYINIIERHIQRCLNKLSVWADTNGFKFSSSI